MSAQPSTPERGFLRREPPVDLTDLQTLCDDGPYLETFMDEVIGLFLKHAPANYDVTRLALEHGDGPSIARASHKLKSQAAYFGARSLVRVCQELEVWGGRGEITRCEQLVDDLEDELDRVIAALLPMHRAMSPRDTHAKAHRSFGSHTEALASTANAPARARR